MLILLNLKSTNLILKNSSLVNGTRVSSESQGRWSNDRRLGVGLEWWRVRRGCRRDFRWCCVNVSRLRWWWWRWYQRTTTEPPRIINASIHRLQPGLEIKCKCWINERIMNCTRKRLLLRMLRRRKWNRQLYRGNKWIFSCRMVMRVMKMITNDGRSRLQWMVMVQMIVVVVGASWIIVVVVVWCVWTPVVMMVWAVGLIACWRFHQSLRLPSRTVFVVRVILHM